MNKRASLEGVAPAQEIRSPVSRHFSSYPIPKMKADDLLYLTWFNAGLRVVDWSNPFEPKELGYYIPAGNKERRTRNGSTSV